jgi:Spx/MgsR family transcriptional regulator
MKLKVYAYEKCGTCRKALKFLDARGVAYTTVPIREQPPTKTELRQMLLLYGGDIRRLFNTAGADYKALNLKEKLAKMSADEAIDLLSRNGNLVKRPFVLSDDRGLIGFKEEEWKKLK